MSMGQAQGLAGAELLRMTLSACVLRARARRSSWGSWRQPCMCGAVAGTTLSVLEIALNAYVATSTHRQVESSDDQCISE